MSQRSWLNNNTFVISDTHFGHKNIAKYEDRPKNHEDVIIKNWNSVVSKHSNILHLGDVFLCPREEAQAWLNKLNGNKWLILGNHDTRSAKVYEEMGFHVIGEPIYKEYNNYNIVFSHHPLMHLPKETFNVHGHIHSNALSYEQFPGQHINMSVEVINYTPVRLSSIHEKIASIQKQRASI